MESSIPVVLFAYSRPEHLVRTLECLRDNHVPLLYVFSDAPRTEEAAPRVLQVREILRRIDWSQVVICEREVNLGLGRSVLSGVSEVLDKYESALIFEDDLVCVPGTYAYLCAALKRYRDSPKVMSVTGWTHPKVTPSTVTVQPYFDGRAECWVWGTWARAWKGMVADAETLMHEYEKRGGDIYKYGVDLVDMARVEKQKNIWAVRFLYWHLVNGGLCLRPPHSMVEHIGFESGSNFSGDSSWLKNPDLKACPAIPAEWPEPVENEQCWRLHQAVCGKKPVAPSLPRRVYRRVREILRRRINGVRAKSV